MTDTITVRPVYSPFVFIVRLINVLIGLIEIAFGLRIILELFGASSSSVFVAWIYGVTSAMLGPFAGAFPDISLGGSSVLDGVAILAMVAYAVLGWLIIELFSFIFDTAAAV